MPLEKKVPAVPQDVESLEKNDDSSMEVPKMKHFRGDNRLDGRSRPRVRTWRTHEDAFKEVWEHLKFKLELNPAQTAKSLLEELVKQDPVHFKISQLRTLQRRVAEWREQQTIYEEQLKRILAPEENGRSQTVENEIASLLMSKSV